MRNHRQKRWWTIGLLIALIIPLFTVIVRATDLNYGSIHLLMGNPSNAMPMVENSSNYLMLKPQYALSYNRERNIPNWASWQLNQSWLGEAKRQDDFRSDPTLPSNWYRVRPTDYAKSGFDKGHVVSSEDRGKSDSDNSATFLMTNMIPQAPDNNRVVWAQFEEACRALAKQGKELYIVAGGSGFGGNGSNCSGARSPWHCAKRCHSKGKSYDSDRCSQSTRGQIQALEGVRDFGQRGGEINWI